MSFFESHYLVLGVNLAHVFLSGGRYSCSPTSQLNIVILSLSFQQMVVVTLLSLLALLCYDTKFLQILLLMQLKITK